MSQQGKEIPKETWDQFIEELQKNFVSIAHTCSRLGIERRTYYYKRTKDPEFASKVDTLFERVQVPIAEEMLRADVMERKAWAIRFTLERASKKWNLKFSDEYLNGLEYRIALIEGRVEQMPSPYEDEEDSDEEIPAY